MLVSIEQFVTRFPRPLSSFERSRSEQLLEDSEEIVAAAFARERRSLEAELAEHPKWLPPVVARVIREMVAAAILVGDAAGKRQSAVTAGMVSESATWADVGSVSWGEPILTDDHRRDMGLNGAALPSGRFPSPPRWPERRL